MTLPRIPQTFDAKVGFLLPRILHITDDLCIHTIIPTELLLGNEKIAVAVYVYGGSH